MSRSDEHRHRVNALGELAGLRLEELIDHLGLKLRKKGKMLVGPCPVHGGRRPDAFNLYPQGHTSRGNWKCRSRGCHLAFKNRQEGSGTVIGFVWGVLSHQRLGWANAGDPRLPFGEVIDFLCGFVGLTLDQVRVDMSEVEKKTFNAQQEALRRTLGEGDKGWPRAAVRARMEVPSAYYLARGYSAEVLDRYDVGRWLPGRAPPGPMAGRAAVPVFDEDYHRVVGVSGRSPWPRCRHCRQYHDPSLPCPAGKSAAAVKWFNQGFRKEATLYNYWFAREHIRRTRLAVLVEGPGDVWRLEEAGVHYSLALFGNELNDPQQVILERSGAMTVALFPHGDAAGERCRQQVSRELGRAFNLHFFALPAKDLGEMGVDAVRRDIVPLLRRLEQKGEW